MKIKIFKKSLLVLFFLSLLPFYTCQKEEFDLGEAIQHETLSDAQLKFFDNQKTVELGIDEIFMPNGLTVKKYLELVDPRVKNGENRKGTPTIKESNSLQTRDKIIGLVMKAATELTKRDNFKSPAEDQLSPAQIGLAYSYGSRDHNIRQLPTGGECQDYKLYGLDCSGFIYRAFLTHAGIDFTKNTTADKQRQPNEIIKAIKKKYTDFDKLKVEDLGKPKSIDEIDPGDIIYWRTMNPETGKKEVSHIGIILRDSKGLKVAQSNGTRKQSSNCEKNWSKERGPNIFSFQPCIGPAPNGFGDDYSIVRIGVEAPDPPDFNKCGIMIRIYGYYHETAPTYTRDTESNNGTIQCAIDAKGSFNKELFEFNGSYTTKIGTVDISGSIKVVMNEDYDAITLVIWKETRTFGTFPYGTRNISCELMNVPNVSKSNFQLEGEKTCNSIISLKNDQSAPQGLSFTLNNHKCTSGSKVLVYFSKE